MFLCVRVAHLVICIQISKSHPIRFPCRALLLSLKHVLPIPVDLACLFEAPIAYIIADLATCRMRLKNLKQCIACIHIVIRNAILRTQLLHSVFRQFLNTLASLFGRSEQTEIFLLFDTSQSHLAFRTDRALCIAQKDSVCRKHYRRRFIDILRVHIRQNLQCFRTIPHLMSCLPNFLVNSGTVSFPRW